MYVDRLLIEIPRPAGDRPQRAVAFAMARDDDHLGIGLHLQDRPQHAKPLARPVGIGRQAKVERHHRRSEEHTSELQSLMRISYAVFCLTTKNHISHPTFSS